MAKAIRIPFFQPEVGSSELEGLQRVLESNYLNQGRITEEFEKKLAEMLGVKYVIATTSGTAALFLSLKGFGIKPGDEVIVPDMTFIATANAASMAGAKVVLVDVDPQTLQMDPAAFERAINRRTKAVMPVHVSGRAAEIGEIISIAKSKKLLVIEDSAEAMASKLNGRFLGTFGDAGILSFSPNKLITTGQGGAVLTDNRQLYLQLKMLRDQGRSEPGSGGDDIYHQLGYNFKFTDLQASVGLAQLNRLPARLKRIQEIREFYIRELSHLINIFPARLSDGEIPLWTDVLVDERAGLDQTLLSDGIQCRNFWFPIHTQAAYRADSKLFPHSTQAAPKALWLPSSFRMSDQDLADVCQSVRDHFKTSRKSALV